ncbi:AbrB/MazE/SpoVT family DNA-binding domain-containing protein [Haladaptatus sp. DYF46]|uniref:AbrB/MazE/SpoVT family DNA-binding domain-containing protein n=1 Tax=Haladaptatus sp. DYF46 TaxID=2886041 RepID=UPI001E640871|nr:AbrB/MazE/SpoVT family DNA-binding domain-containing protein [Haladaptatus sp. DYF46]
MGEVEMDGRGRITIPKEVRKRLGMRPGDTFEFTTDDGDIHLHPKREGIVTIRRGEDWGDEAFHDAGEATFGDE